MGRKIGREGTVLNVSARHVPASGSLPGEAGHGHPEILDGSDDVEELGQVDRLGDVAVGTKAVGPADVFLRLRRGQDDHRNSLEGLIGLDFRQHLSPVFARQVQIQQDQIGSRAVGVLALSSEESQRFDTVGDMAEVFNHAPLIERLAGEPSVAWIIFDQEDLNFAW